MQKLYTKKNFVVFYRAEKKEYVVYNLRKKWEEGHTHVHSYNQANYLVEASLKKKIPQKGNKYFYISLIRINKDKTYIDKIQRHLDNKFKTNRYYNRPANLHR